jgi:hypothetical protein
MVHILACLEGATVQPRRREGGGYWPPWTQPILIEGQNSTM